MLPKYAWYHSNSQERAWPVGSKKPNDFGLFDVQGIVFTWCQENYRVYPGTTDVTQDVEGELEISSSHRVLRGGSFNNQASTVRSSDRYSSVPTGRNSNFGFRVPRTLPLDGFAASPLPPKGIEK